MPSHIPNRNSVNFFFWVCLRGIAYATPISTEDLHCNSKFKNSKLVRIRADFCNRFICQWYDDVVGLCWCMRRPFLAYVVNNFRGGGSSFNRTCPTDFFKLQSSIFVCVSIQVFYIIWNDNLLRLQLWTPFWVFTLYSQ